MIHILWTTNNPMTGTNVHLYSTGDKRSDDFTELVRVGFMYNGLKIPGLTSESEIKPVSQSVGQPARRFSIQSWNQASQSVCQLACRWGTLTQLFPSNPTSSPPSTFVCGEQNVLLCCGNLPFIRCCATNLQCWKIREDRLLKMLQFLFLNKIMLPFPEQI